MTIADTGFGPMRVINGEVARAETLIILACERDARAEAERRLSLMIDRCAAQAHEIERLQRLLSAGTRRIDVEAVWQRICHEANDAGALNLDMVRNAISAEVVS